MLVVVGASLVGSVGADALAASGAAVQRLFVEMWARCVHVLAHIIPASEGGSDPRE